MFQVCLAFTLSTLWAQVVYGGVRRLSVIMNCACPCMPEQGILFLAFEKCTAAILACLGRVQVTLTCGRYRRPSGRRLAISPLLPHPWAACESPCLLPHRVLLPALALVHQLIYYCMCQLKRPHFKARSNPGSHLDGRVFITMCAIAVECIKLQHTMLAKALPTWLAG